MPQSRREKLELMLQSDPADQMLRYMLALELEKEGDHERSLELLIGLTQDNPAYVPAFLMAGQQLARLARIQEARQMYADGIEQALTSGDEHAAGEMAQFKAELPE